MRFFSAVMIVGRVTAACSIWSRLRMPISTQRANRHARKSDHRNKLNNKPVITTRTMMAMAASRARKTMTPGTNLIITLI